MDILTLTLPWPPSVNHYWLQCGSRRYISERGQTFRKEVKERFKVTKFAGFAQNYPLKVSILLFPPDKRRRDIDNILKATLDALEHAGLYADDSQIVEIHVIKTNVIANYITVTIQCL